MRILMALMLLLATACSGVYPVTTGSFSTLTPTELERVKISNPIVIVVGQNPTAVSTAISIIQQMGARVVERARLDEIIQEQRLRLAQDSETDMLKIGRMLGATQIVFVEATVTPETQTRAFYLSNAGAGLASHSAYHVSVSVRGVNVESGIVRWTGSAWFPEPVNTSDQAVVIATGAAMGRAFCEQKRGVWDEKHGCKLS